MLARVLPIANRGRALGESARVHKDERFAAGTAQLVRSAPGLGGRVQPLLASLIQHEPVAQKRG